MKESFWGTGQPKIVVLIKVLYVLTIGKNAFKMVKVKVQGLLLITIVLDMRAKG